MKFQELRDCYYDNTRQASTLVRQLCFAGIAVVWIFHNGSPDQISLPNQLARPLVFFIVALSFDLSQYMIGSVLWGLLGEVREQQLKKQNGYSPDADVYVPCWMNWPGIAFFWLKAVAAALGYLFLGIELFRIVTWDFTNG